MKRLGSGSFGVMKVADVSTGNIYVRTTFKEPPPQKETAWLEKIANEIEIMEKY